MRTRQPSLLVLLAAITAALLAAGPLAFVGDLVLRAATAGADRLTDVVSSATGAPAESLAPLTWLLTLSLPTIIAVVCIRALSPQASLVARIAAASASAVGAVWSVVATSNATLIAEPLHDMPLPHWAWAVVTAVVTAVPLVGAVLLVGSDTAQ